MPCPGRTEIRFRKYPLVFCGNTAVRPYLNGILGDQFSITFADNIRPDGLHFNLKPAITEVHRLFMDHVMQMAPGYSRLSSMVSSPVIPTPAGVERILELYSRNIPGGVVMADMGGATTDIFSRVEGEFQRTVAANTGMSYSLSNILREAEPENVFRHIPGVGQGPGRNWVLGKPFSQPPFRGAALPWPWRGPRRRRACALPGGTISTWATSGTESVLSKKCAGW